MAGEGFRLSRGEGSGIEGLHPTTCGPKSDRITDHPVRNDRSDFCHVRRESHPHALHCKTAPFTRSLQDNPGFGCTPGKQNFQERILLTRLKKAVELDPFYLSCNQHTDHRKLRGSGNTVSAQGWRHAADARSSQHVVPRGASAWLSKAGFPCDLAGRLV
jgi:hypothetical protein